MDKSKKYSPVHFSADVLRDAYEEFLVQVDPGGQSDLTHFLSVEIEDSEWGHDSLEEFFADYRRTSGSGLLSVEARTDSTSRLRIHVIDYYTTLVNVRRPNRSQIEAVFEVFEKNVEASRLQVESIPETSPTIPTVFIGHGRSSLWRDLKDHLQDQHGYEVVAYEVGARAGHGIRDILEEMLHKSRFALRS